VYFLMITTVGGGANRETGANSQNLLFVKGQAPGQGGTRLRAKRRNERKSERIVNRLVRVVSDSFKGAKD